MNFNILTICFKDKKIMTNEKFYRITKKLMKIIKFINKIDNINFIIIFIFFFIFHDQTN